VRNPLWLFIIYSFTDDLEYLLLPELRHWLTLGNLVKSIAISPVSFFAIITFNSQRSHLFYLGYIIAQRYASAAAAMAWWMDSTTFGRRASEKLGMHSTSGLGIGW